MAQSARTSRYQQIHFLRKSFTYADDGSTLTIGVLPAGATIIKPISGVQVDTVFNAATTNVLDIGKTGTADYFATDLALGTATFVPIDVAVGLTMAAETTITATVDLTGTAATTGAGEIIIAYAPDNDG